MLDSVVSCDAALDMCMLLIIFIGSELAKVSVCGDRWILELWLKVAEKTQSWWLGRLILDLPETCEDPQRPPFSNRFIVAREGATELMRL